MATRTAGSDDSATKQTSFASAEYSGKKRQTRRERFLAEMNTVVPWARLEALIEPHYPTIKIICRYQQFEAANKIVERVLAGYPKKGLIWHFQGSGKSLLMVFAAQKLRLRAGLKNPTVLIVVDRIDLDTQITGTFTGADIPNLEKADTRENLQQLLAQDVRKIIITTIFKFGDLVASGPATT